MSMWRVIITDTERATGIAPVCEEPRHLAWAKVSDVEGEPATGAGPLVFDCCPHPHIECWSEGVAEAMAESLTSAGAEACS